jgi:hypothetical protein
MHFRSKGGHPLRLATSQGYETRASVEKVIESVKTNAPKAKVAHRRSSSHATNTSSVRE